MLITRLSLLLSLLTLLCWAPHAEVNSADGYHLEKVVVDAGFSSERQPSSDEPDIHVGAAVSKPFSPQKFSAYYRHVSRYYSVINAVYQARAPPPGFVFNV